MNWQQKKETYIQEHNTGMSCVVLFYSGLYSVSWKQQNQCRLYATIALG